MDIIKVTSYEEMSAEAAKIIIDRVKETPSITLGLATGGTPIGTYKKLVEDYGKSAATYQHVSTVNLDEYIGLSGDHPQSYRMYMENHLFKHIDIPAHQTYLPDGTAENLMKECQRYDQLIENMGGVDLQLLGIGQNGHIGFNEPGTPFNSRTHIIDLMESTRKANSRYFPTLESVPEQAITMGIQSIFESKEILLLASGQKKAEAIYKLLEGKISEDFPASILRNHLNVTLIADAAALSHTDL
ncbi:glucosamine-6-phosphate deaminase [Halobacillus sp. A1]|uniref:glucosamine-6-phosphate deaminase n=1 Tax=Halobacillus sp. A1 TaxID=2880262 RepID=UPI0020A635F8|nr:glucosamine-6-phosphate deaminase [Halobacillus sp. A1]MCP3030939.1 glucosamine-6-phosphate deaminase [Halobacillus sp. A1]